MQRLERPLSLEKQVEKILREAIAQGHFPEQRLPTEVELAERFGVSRETVRRAAENLQREGLLVKLRRKGTFTRGPTITLEATAPPATLLGYLQADYGSAQVAVDPVTHGAGSLMLQGALGEASEAGLQLVVKRAAPPQMGQAFREIQQSNRLRGVIFASYGEEKLLRRVAGLGLPTVLLDHDLHLPQISSVRDDSFGGARQAVQYLAEQGHRRIAFAAWQRTDLNPWRLQGYRQGLREAGLPARRSWVFATELTAEGARKLLDNCQILAPRPTALLCFNNSLARLVLAEARQCGLAVPGALSVMGCGGEEVASLTCHQTDWYHMGQLAVQVLLRAQQGQTLPEHHLSPHTLRLGQTTAPPV